MCVLFFLYFFQVSSYASPQLLGQFVVGGVKLCFVLDCWNCDNMIINNPIQYVTWLEIIICKSEGFQLLHVRLKLNITEVFFISGALSDNYKALPRVFKNIDIWWKFFNPGILPFYLVLQTSTISLGIMPNTYTCLNNCA